MKIEGKGPGSNPADRIQGVQSREGAAGPQRKAVDESARSDRVEISAAGRARSQGVGSTPDSEAPRPIPADDPSRMEQVRERVSSGFYRSEEVQSEVARRIVARGDHLS